MILIVGSTKGGVGKTTLAFNFAVALAKASWFLTKGFTISRTFWNTSLLLILFLPFFEYNTSVDIAEAKANNKRVMLFFTQDNCPYCNALVERNLAQKEIEQRMRERFEVIAINMWGDREIMGLDGTKHTEKSFAASLKVQFTPTLLFFDETGKTILRLNGYLPPARFKTALEYVAQGREKEISYRDYIAANT